VAGLGILSRVLSELNGGAKSAAQVIESNTEAGEEVVCRLIGTGPLVVEHDDEATHGSTESEAFVAVTDRRLVMAVETDGETECVDFQFTAIRRVELSGRVVRPKLELRLWDGTTYRLPVKRTQGLGAELSYLEAAIECWQRVGSMFTNAEQAIDELERAIVDGNLKDAFDSREKSRQKLAQAADVLAETEVETAPLERRIEALEAARHRSEIRARTSLATRLVTEGDQQTRDGEYERAYRSYWRARDQLENAAAIARENELSEPATIREEIDRIEHHLEHLSVRPLGLAKQAHERARLTGHAEEAVENWEAAHEHYRDALEVGWGADLGFRGETEAIRDVLVRVVRNRMWAYTWYVSELETEGDRLRENDEYPQAKRAYEEALARCGEAFEFAREYDLDARATIPETRHRINAKYESVRWELA